MAGLDIAERDMVEQRSLHGLYDYMGDAKTPPPQGSQVLILISEIRITDSGSSRLNTRGS